MHRTAVALAVKDLTAEGFIVQGTEVYAQNSIIGGPRIYDIVALAPDGTEAAFEVKTTAVGNLRLVTSQVAFDALTVENPGSTTAYTSVGPVMVDRVGYLGYYQAGVAAAKWQARALQETLNLIGVSMHINGSIVAPLPLPPDGGR